ncbi:hypothetical protein ABMA28_006033 [Loxostege sticticalis]|uniref:Uncharacterized protein n=1 Tax=Loxostege sticticalis TaxID=481309 RepID=A0ABD0SM18_LOXSC
MSDVHLRCINCDVRLTHLRRHVLSAEDENLVNIIQLWTYPRDRTETDCICQACWELANHQLLHENEQAHATQQVGHRCVCISCGRSILRAPRRQVVRPNANEEERMIAAIITAWVHPRQVNSVHQVCVPCWLRAQRASRSGHLSGLTEMNQQLQSADDSAPSWMFYVFKFYRRPTAVTHCFAQCFQTGLQNVDIYERPP